MFTIGEFSKITGLSVKTLRFYHEKGLLAPAAVDRATGYRSYDDRNVDLARVIVTLRELEFSLDDIATIVADCADDEDLLVFWSGRSICSASDWIAWRAPQGKLIASFNKPAKRGR